MAFNNLLVKGLQYNTAQAGVFSTHESVLSGGTGVYTLTADQLKDGLIVVTDKDAENTISLTMPLATDMTESYGSGAIFVGMSFMVYFVSNAAGTTNTMNIITNTGWTKNGSVQSSDDSGRVVMIRVLSINATTGVVGWE